MRWGVLRSILRRSFLNDNLPSETQRKWSDEDLLNAVTFALVDFCAHTAVATATAVPIDLGQEIIPLPDNCYDIADVAIDDGTNRRYLTYAPRGERGDYGIWANQIVLSSASTSVGTALIRYFAYYPTPASDSDDIPIPQWATAAICYRAMTHALVKVGIKIAGIGNFRQSPDKGDPEDNAFVEYANWAMKMYNIELSLVPRQERETR